MPTNPLDGKVLTSDAYGVGTWQDPQWGKVLTIYDAINDDYKIVFDSDGNIVAVE
jgi:hypothetical protein